MKNKNHLCSALLLGLAFAAGPALAEVERLSPKDKHPVDVSGRKRTGVASFYGKEFHGRKMADGGKMNPHGNNAASRTLPLGTTAKVTNLETGQAAVVTIRDRGPYVKGRIVDLSPATARAVGITPQDGLAPVEVTPILIPMPDGSVKRGAGAKGDPRGNLTPEATPGS